MTRQTTPQITRSEAARRAAAIISTRKAMGTIDELATLAGVSRQTIYKWGNDLLDASQTALDEDTSQSRAYRRTF